MKQLFAFTATVILSLSSYAAPQEDALLKELTGKDMSKLSDVDVYSEIVGAYQADDLTSVKSRLKILLKKHPASAYADNALYLAGRLSLDKKNYAEALRYFERVTREYPRSNKVVAAEFAKAIAYNRMNLPQQAKKVFQEVGKKFPGSPEAYRAQSELRLLR